MIKVMIVDDEYLVRIGMRSTINWEENGFIIVGDAADGVEALQKYKELLPDIVITDVRMPKMDGIELTEHIKNINQETEIAFFSSYSDFEYAKKAMKLGVKDYLLKAAMEPDEILNTMIQIKNRIEARELKSRTLDTLQCELAQHKEKLESRIFREYLKGILEYEGKAIDRLREAGITLPYDSFAIVCAQIDDINIKYKNLANDAKKILRETILSILKSNMTKDYQGAVEEYEEGVFICVLSVNSSKYSCEDAGLLFAQFAGEALSRYTQVTLSMSISKSIYKFENVHKQIKPTLNILKYKIIYGRKAIIEYRKVAHCEQAEKSTIECGEDKIHFFLLNGEVEKAREIVEKVFYEMAEDICSVSSIDYVCTQYISMLNRLCGELGINRESSSKYYSFEEVSCLESMREMCDWINEQLLSISRKILVYGHENESRIIKEVKKYIRSEYMNNITLGTAADHANISRVYLSQLFKQETDENFIDFLNRVRIEKAKEYLMFETIKTYEVAQKVGFQDSSYFSRIFKKFVGETPTDFQKKNGSTTQ